MKSFLTLKSVDEVLSIIDRAECLSPELADLAECAGRRIAETFYAPFDLPGFDRSTVDGYAARASDLFGASESSPAILRCLGECKMGARPDLEIAAGETAVIYTGGMLPKGADCAVMVEHSRKARDGLIEIGRPQAPGDNVVFADEDAARGQELLAKGALLRPQEIGALASFGIAKALVARRPRVAIISTGDEIVPVGQPLEPGQIYDVNSYTLAALCREAGAEILQMGIIRDKRESFRSALASSLSAADLVAVSGGSSAGMRDLTVETFLELPGAELLVHGVAISPGKPFILARAGAKWLVGLPGHVSSAIICARTFLLPLLARLQGQIPGRITPGCKAILSRSIASAQGRRDYIRCRLEKKEGEYLATPLTAPSAVISGLLLAEGLIVCPENSEGLAAGEKVDVQFL